MSKLVRLTVVVPDAVYDNANEVKEYTDTTIEAVLSVAAQQAMSDIAEKVKDLLKWHGLEEK